MKNDDIKKVPRYNLHPSGVECREVIENLSFKLANVFKYVFRRDYKGSCTKDLQKALEYIEWEYNEYSYLSNLPIVRKNVIRAKLMSVERAEKNHDAKLFYRAYLSYFVLMSDSFYNPKSQKLHIEKLYAMSEAVQALIAKHEARV